MAKIKNVSPLGDLSIPSLGLEIKAGATAEVSDEAAALLLAQPENWAAADQAARDAAAAKVPAQMGTTTTDQEGQAFQDSLANVPAKKRGGKVKGKC